MSTALSTLASPLALSLASQQRLRDSNVKQMEANAAQQLAKIAAGRGCLRIFNFGCDVDVNARVCVCVVWCVCACEIESESK